MKILALDSFRLGCCLSFLAVWTASPQGNPSAKASGTATVNLLSEAPRPGSEPKKMTGDLHLNARGPTMVWAAIRLDGVKYAQGPKYIEWQINDGSGWRPLRAERPRKTLDFRTLPSLTPNSLPVPSQTAPLQRLIGQELTAADKGTLRVRVLARDENEIGQAEVKLAN